MSRSPWMVAAYVAGGSSPRARDLVLAAALALQMGRECRDLELAAALDLGDRRDPLAPDHDLVAVDRDHQRRLRHRLGRRRGELDARRRQATR